MVFNTASKLTTSVSLATRSTLKNQSYSSSLSKAAAGALTSASEPDCRSGPKALRKPKSCLAISGPDILSASIAAATRSGGSRRTGGSETLRGINKGSIFIAHLPNHCACGADCGEGRGLVNRPVARRRGAGL